MAVRKRARRLGVTMRETQAHGYREPRDALARDWIAFLEAALPEVAWMPVPNLGSGAARFADCWRLDGLVLSGGEDVGKSGPRDRTEAQLLESFLRHRRPVLGVCRGFQNIQRHFGGRLSRIPGDAHIGKRHAVELLEEGVPVAWRREAMTVNSYHGIGIRCRDLAPPFQPFAVTPDGFVEGAVIPEARVLGVMWHPERERAYRTFDRVLVRWVFGY